MDYQRLEMTGKEGEVIKGKTPVNSARPYVDDYTGFTWNNIHSSTYNCFIENTGHLEFVGAPSFTNNFVSPSFQTRTYYTGMQNGSKKFSLNLVFYQLTLKELNAAFHWLDRTIVSDLFFDYEPYWKYSCKLASIGTIEKYVNGRTMYRGRPCDLYLCRVAVQFETVYHPEAISTYCAYKYTDDSSRSTNDFYAYSRDTGASYMPFSEYGDVDIELVLTDIENQILIDNNKQELVVEDKDRQWRSMILLDYDEDEGKHPAPTLADTNWWWDEDIVMQPRVTSTYLVDFKSNDRQYSGIKFNGRIIAYYRNNEWENVYEVGNWVDDEYRYISFLNSGTDLTNKNLISMLKQATQTPPINTITINKVWRFELKNPSAYPTYFKLHLYNVWSTATIYQYWNNDYFNNGLGSSLGYDNDGDGWVDVSSDNLDIDAYENSMCICSTTLSLDHDVWLDLHYNSEDGTVLCANQLIEQIYSGAMPACKAKDSVANVYLPGAFDSDHPSTIMLEITIAQRVDDESHKPQVAIEYDTYEYMV